MGVLRWAGMVLTGGLAPGRLTSPRERTAKAAERVARQARIDAAAPLGVVCSNCGRPIKAHKAAEAKACAVALSARRR
jgi:hypothetical protein